MGKTILTILISLFTLGLSAQDFTRALSPNELWEQAILHRLDSITEKVEKSRYSVGYCIYDLTADSMLYRYNSQKKLKPASTQKLFVSITALSTLGINYTFNTNVCADGNIRVDRSGHRYLDGDICVRGSFDPTMDVNAVVFLGDKVLGLNIDSIAGKIIVDNGVRIDDKKIKHAQQYFASSLYDYLANKGMRFSSPEPYEASPTPITRGWCLGTIETPMPKVLNSMLKKSNNTYAECMLLNLYSMGRDSEWTYDKCREQVREKLVDAKGNTDEYTIIDGSGLSHDNRSTPEQLINILRYAYHNKDVYPYIYENLPIAGIDGTLSDRMKNGPAYNNVRAKTGTLNGVSTLAGYATASNGHQLAFSIMVNNVAIATGKTLQNNICQELAR